MLSYGIKIKKKTKEIILNHERTWIVDERNWDSLLLQELISFLKVSIAHYWEFLLSFRMLIIFRLTWRRKLGAGRLLTVWSCSISINHSTAGEKESMYLNITLPAFSEWIRRCITTQYLVLVQLCSSIIGTLGDCHSARPYICFTLGSWIAAYFITTVILKEYFIFTQCIN